VTLHDHGAFAGDIGDITDREVVRRELQVAERESIRHSLAWCDEWRAVGKLRCNHRW
jgi:hypothetical protein